MLPLMCKRMTFSYILWLVCKCVNHLWHLQMSHASFANIRIIMQTWTCIWLIVVAALWRNEWLWLRTDEIWERGWDIVTFLQMLHVTFANIKSDFYICKLVKKRMQTSSVCTWAVTSVTSTGMLIHCQRISLSRTEQLKKLGKH